MKTSFVMCLALTFMIGCGGGANTTSSDSASSSSRSITMANVAGSWNIFVTSSVFDNQYKPMINAFLTQAGNQVPPVRGEYTGNMCNSRTLNMTGIVTGSAVEFTIRETSGDITTVKATVMGDRMNGEYSTVGSCAPNDKGSVTGIRYPGIAGNWSGTMTISGYGTTALGGTLNTDSNGRVTGTLNATGSTCLTKLTFSGFQAGSFIWENYLSDVTGTLVAIDVAESGEGTSLAGHVITVSPGGTCPATIANPNADTITLTKVP